MYYRRKRYFGDDSASTSSSVEELATELIAPEGDEVFVASEASIIDDDPFVAIEAASAEASIPYESHETSPIGQCPSGPNGEPITLWEETITYRDGQVEKTVLPCPDVSAIPKCDGWHALPQGDIYNPTYACPTDETKAMMKEMVTLMIPEITKALPTMSDEALQADFPLEQLAEVPPALYDEDFALLMVTEYYNRGLPVPEDLLLKFGLVEGSELYAMEGMIDTLPSSFTPAADTTPITEPVVTKKRDMKPLLIGAAVVGALFLLMPKRG